MLKKTLAAAVIGAGSLLAIAAPATASPEPSSSEVGQIGLVNINDTLNNACLLPWGDGQVLAVKIPIASGQQYQACNDGKSVQSR